MPELPEVETTVNYLKKRIVGKRIIDVWSDWNKLIKKPATFRCFREKIKNKKIIGIKRKGKNIIFTLSGKMSLLIHQKLTGHLLYGVWKKENGCWQAGKNLFNRDSANKFIHLVFFLDNGKQIVLSDARKFAKIELSSTKDIENKLLSLGPDPLKISFSEFKKKFLLSRKKIKAALMDQEIISGVGNIYSDEALFAAAINPLRQVFSLSDAELKKLYFSLQEILKKGIKMNGASVSDYRKPDGSKGSFDKIIKVYRRQGKSCPCCNTTIKAVKISGRTAHYCPTCQPLSLKNRDKAAINN